MSLAENLRSLTTRLAQEIKALRTRPRAIMAACSDETSALTTGLKTTFRMPHAMTLTSVRATLTTASTSGAAVVDVRVDGVSLFQAKPSVAANAKSGAGTLTSATVEVADNAEITIHCEAAGSGATGLKVSMIGRV